MTRNQQPEDQLLDPLDGEKNRGSPPQMSIKLVITGSALKQEKEKNSLAIYFEKPVLQGLSKVKD